MSKYMFLGSRNSNMASIFHFDLSEVTFHDLWPPIRGQNSKFLIWHDVCQNICFWGLGAQIWHWFFLLTSLRSPVMTSNLWSDIKNSKFLIWYYVIQNICFESISSNMVFVFHFDLSKVKSHDLCPLIRGQNSKFLIWHDVCQNICFWGQGVQIWHWIFILTSQRSPLMTSVLCSKVKTQNSLFGMMYV